LLTDFPASLEAFVGSFFAKSEIMQRALFKQPKIQQIHAPGCLGRRETRSKWVKDLDVN
jgi:hypothetical protein